ncbi:MAG TPA: winged helix-turn-helix domain-containing protein [Nitrososphaera sp.]|jgi:predicted transcriptional regulator|nr:winged helix-turn-helix domain-containing protein [Nitrososphaera sp.]
MNTEYFTEAFINVYRKYRLLALQEQEKIKNRSKLDIIYDILVSATGGVKKTHIMSHANLSSEQMNYYFNTLLSHRLLNAEKDSDDNLVYKTTHKGVRFLHCCAQIKSLIAPVAKVKMRSDLLFL